MRRSVLGCSVLPVLFLAIIGHTQLAHAQPSVLEYKNTQYGFSLQLPPGYEICKKPISGLVLTESTPTTFEISKSGDKGFLQSKYILTIGNVSETLKNSTSPLAYAQSKIEIRESMDSEVR